MLLRKSLKQWQSELPGEQFIRVHRRAIVNLAFLDRIERLPAGRLQIHLRGVPEAILVGLSQTPVLNRKAKGAKRLSAGCFRPERAFPTVLPSLIPRRLV